MAEAGNTKQYPWSSVYYAKQSTIGFLLFNKNTYIDEYGFTSAYIELWFENSFSKNFPGACSHSTWILNKFSKETVVLRRWKSITG